MRIAFDSLKNLGKKENRRMKMVINNANVQNIISLINNKEYDAADFEVKKEITTFSDSIINSFKNK